MPLLQEKLATKVELLAVEGTAGNPLCSVGGLGSACWRNHSRIQRNHLFLKRKNQSWPFSYSGIHVLMLFVATVLPNHINSFMGQIVMGARSALRALNCQPWPQVPVLSSKAAAEAVWPHQDQKHGARGHRLCVPPVGCACCAVGFEFFFNSCCCPWTPVWWLFVSARDQWPRINAGVRPHGRQIGSSWEMGNAASGGLFAQRSEGRCFFVCCWKGDFVGSDPLTILQAGSP